MFCICSQDHVRPVAGLLHGAAALLVELARATAAGMHAAEGGPAAIIGNAAATIDAVSPGGRGGTGEGQGGEMPVDGAEVMLSLWGKPLLKRRFNDSILLDGNSGKMCRIRCFPGCQGGAGYCCGWWMEASAQYAFTNIFSELRDHEQSAIHYVDTGKICCGRWRLPLVIGRHAKILAKIAECR